MSGRRLATLVATAAMGMGTAVGMAACGDDERGSVEVEGAGTATTGTGTAAETVGTAAETAPSATETTGTTTSP